jgi:hypothetical protein
MKKKIESLEEARVQGEEIIRLEKEKLQLEQLNHEMIMEKASFARVGVARENGYGKKKNSMGTNGSRNIMDIEKEASFARVGMEREDGYLKEKVSIGTIESRRENNDS